MRVAEVIEALQALKADDIIAVQWVTKEDTENNSGQDITDEQWEEIADEAQYGAAERFSRDVADSVADFLRD